MDEKDKRLLDEAAYGVRTGFGTKFHSAKSALEGCSHMLQACGYNLDEYGGDHTGCLYILTRKDGTKVTLELKEG